MGRWLGTTLRLHSSIQGRKGNAIIMQGLISSSDDNDCTIIRQLLIDLFIIVLANFHEMTVTMHSVSILNYAEKNKSFP